MNPKKFSFATLAFAAALALALPAVAGDLEPPGPPGSTMKSLDEIPGSWHRMLDSTNGDVNGCNSDRFKCVMNNDEAVLDLETGFVWHRTVVVAASWSSAGFGCTNSDTGGRAGWRLPTWFEILTLRDPSQADGLPLGHPFLGVPATMTGGVKFWTITRDPNSSQGVIVRLNGQVSRVEPQTSESGRWCVRAPSSAPPSDGNPW